MIFLCRCIAILCLLHSFKIVAFADSKTTSGELEKYRSVISESDIQTNKKPPLDNDISNSYDEAESFFQLGLKYQADKDMLNSVKCYETAAKYGHHTAQVVLGVMYHIGNGVPQDYQQAKKWYEKAAEQGFADAQYNLGLLYTNGEGVLQDYQQAKKWYEKAAEQGHAGAQCNLGILYDNGEGVPQDYQQAKKWYEKAAEQGHAGAQNNLGLLYTNGNGIPRDYVTAYSWISIAKANGSEKSKEVLITITDLMTKEQISEAQKQASLM